MVAYSVRQFIVTLDWLSMILSTDGYIKILEVALNKMLTILILLLLQTLFSRARRARLANEW